MTADGVKRTRILRKIGGLLIVGAAAWWTAVSSCLAGGTEEIYVIGSRDDYPMEYYNEDTDKPGECEVIVAKHRSGPTGTVDVTWLGKYTRFADKSSIGR